MKLPKEELKIQIHNYRLLKNEAKDKDEKWYYKGYVDAVAYAYGHGTLDCMREYNIRVGQLTAFVRIKAFSYQISMVCGYVNGFRYALEIKGI